MELRTNRIKFVTSIFPSQKHIKTIKVSIRRHHLTRSRNRNFEPRMNQGPNPKSTLGELLMLQQVTKTDITTYS